MFAPSRPRPLGNVHPGQTCAPCPAPPPSTAVMSGSWCGPPLRLAYWPWRSWAASAGSAWLPAAGQLDSRAGWRIAICRRERPDVVLAPNSASTPCGSWRGWCRHRAAADSSHFPRGRCLLKPLPAAAEAALPASVAALPAPWCVKSQPIGEAPCAAWRASGHAHCPC